MSTILFIIAIVAFYFGIKGMRKNKKEKNISDKLEPPQTTIDQEPVVIPQPGPEKPLQKHFYFNVAGITKKNDKGQDIQRLIRQYVRNELELTGDAYYGMTNKEIYESGEDRVFEADISGSYEITFEPEPDNPYDPKAIKVIHSEIGHIGYVPREFTDQVHSVLKNKEYRIEWKLTGGKYKYVDYEEDRVKTGTLNYGITIDVYYTP